MNDKQALIAEVYALATKVQATQLKLKEALQRSLDAHSEFHIGDRITWDRFTPGPSGSVIEIAGSIGNPDKPWWMVKEDVTGYTIRVEKQRNPRLI